MKYDFTSAFSNKLPTVALQKAKLPFAIVLFIALLAGSCGRWLTGKNPSNTPTTNYEYFYQLVKENYSFFAEKRVKWDSLDQVYRPLVHDKMGNDSLYTVMSEMLFSLKDGHVNLYINNDRSRNADWYLDYPANFNRGFVHRNYWGKDYQASGALINTWLPDSIGYVYYSSFRSSFSKSNLDYVLNRFANAKGLIIDVRENGGGSMRNAFRLAERFVSERTFMGTSQYKTGPGADDFSPPDSIFVKPLVDYKARAEAQEKKKKKEDEEKPEEKEEDKAEEPTTKPGRWMTADSTGMMIDKPVVVLINRHSYSATNFFASFMSNIPNVTLIGDRSGGGGGVPVSFELPNGWKFRISVTRTYLPNGYNIEEGIEPDIYQNTGPADELKGVDAIIERAKTHILEQGK